MREGYKITEIGEIPIDWDIVTLGDIFKLSSGEGLSKNLSIEGDCPVYGGNGVSFYHTKYTHEDPQIIIGRVGAYCGCVHKTTPKSWITDNALFIKNKLRNYDDEFLFYVLNKLNLNTHANKNAQPVISGQKIYPILIGFPKMEEQQKIAKILSTLDDKIDVLEEQIKETEILKKGLMKKLLTKGIGHTKFKNSEVGEIPEGWSFGKVEFFCEIDNNLRKPINSENRMTMKGEYPYYGPTGIVDYINEYSVEGEYTLIGEDGDHFLKYNDWSMTHLIKGKFNVNNHAHLIRGKGDCTTEWVYVFFQHRNIINYLTRQGAGRYKLTKASLLNLPMLVPPLVEQNKIIEVINSIAEKLKILLLRKENYLEFKKGLMQKLLTGKIRVKL
jgi:type I restriction enzyme S subunit